VKLLVDRSMAGPRARPTPRILVDGAGKPSSGGDVLDNDYATAAVTPTASSAPSTCRRDRTLTIDQTKLGAGATAQWFDPTDGSFRPATAPLKDARQECRRRPTTGCSSSTQDSFAVRTLVSASSSWCCRRRGKLKPKATYDVPVILV